MPRKGPAPRHELVADPIYRSVQVTQLINKVMLHGKRSVAETIVYDAMKVIETKTGEGPLDTVKRAIDDVKPPLEVKSRPRRRRQLSGAGRGAAAPCARSRSAGSST